MPVSEKFGNVVSWATDLDDKTRAQAERSAALPFVDGHIALMPDAHYGYGATIGSVIPTKGAIIPSAVGVDIGCGMVASATTLTSHDLPDDLGELHHRLVDAIPAGMGKGHRAADRSHGRLPEPPAHFTPRQEATARNQFGSLGGGNHFVEVCLDETDRVWIVLHSGSRGIGNQLANIHIDRAKGLMAEWFIALADPDLAYLPEGSADFDAYIADMSWSQDYAAGNRDAMMAAAVDQLARFLDRDVPVTETINCHHNFTEMENHRGRNVWLTRKGAIRARTGDRGIIPGSMGASTFVVTGLGNDSAYHSCSHGAGRTMSRSQARKRLDLDTFRSSMAGRTWDEAKADELVDEDPRAYKSIDEVMANQADLVQIDHTLHQILNMKGTR